MVPKSHAPIAAEGAPALAVTAVLGLVLSLVHSSYWLLFFGTVFIVLLFLFRDPGRKIPAVPLGLVSPVNGVIAEVSEGQDPFLQRDAVCVEIEMNAAGPYTLRSPTEGRVHEQWFGARGRGNIQYACCVQTDEKDEIVWGIRAKQFWRPRTHLQTGERIGQGQRVGFLIFGGRVVVYLPINCRVDVKQGMQVSAGQTIIGTMVHQAPVSSLAEPG